MSTETETDALAKKALFSLFGDRPVTLDGTAAHSSKDSALFRYWKKPDGYVTIGPDHRTDSHGYIRYEQIKRYKPLPLTYGVEMYNQAGGTMHVGKGWLMLRNFTENGGLTAKDEAGDFGEKGAYLLPRQQLIDLHMHRDKNIWAARPDLWDHKDIECSFGCIADTGEIRYFTSKAAYDQHCVSQHAETQASKAVGTAIADVMGKSQPGTSPEAIAAIVAAVLAALEPRQQAAIAATSLSTGTPTKRPVGRPRKPTAAKAAA